MRKNGYKRRWLCGVLALISGFVLPGAVQANSGLSDTMQAIDGPNYNYYVGANGASNNAVNVDESVKDAGIIGGYTFPAEGNVKAEHNQVTVNGSINIGGEVAGGYADSASGSAEANDNTVTVNGNAFIDGEIYGGWAYSEGSSARADNNEVNVHGNIEGLYYVAGGYAYAADDAAAENNRVTMNGGTVYVDVYGGWASSKNGVAKSDNNTIWLSGEAAVNGNVVGGLVYGGADGAEANHNNVILDGGTVGEDIYGGYAASGSGSSKANDNQVTMSAGEVNGFIYDGYAKSDSGSAEASNNGVTVRGGVVEGNVYGGYADSNADSTASSNNRVTVNAGNIIGSIYGGDAFTAAGFGNDDADYNTVTVSGSKVSGNIYGGYAQSYHGSAKASNNSVTISDSTVDNETKSSGIYGGYAIILSGSGSAEASNNNVTVSGSKVSSAIYGGYAQSSSGSAGTNNNSVMMSGGNIEGSIYGGYARSPSGSTAASSNRAIVSRGSIIGGIYGGYANTDSGSGSAAADNNSVMISGGTVVNNAPEDSICGGYAESYSGRAEASNNNVTISGGMVTGNVYGGRVYSENQKSTDTTAAVKGNCVSISGGTVTGNVYGGHANSVSGSVAVNNSIMVSGGTVTEKIYGGYADSLYGTNKATDNKVILSGTADVSGADLYGSNLASGTNNNLVINGWSGTVNSLHNFDQLEVRAVAGGQNLTDGSNLRLIAANKIEGCNFYGQTVNGIQAGVALTVDGRVSVSDDNTVSVIASDVRVRDQTVIAVESRAASVAAVGRGAEAVTDSLDTLRGSGEGLSTFASIIGSRSRYNTGSHADVNGWNGIVGTAWTRELTSGTLSCGAFYENGGGSYDTHNTINGRTYRGDGDTVYNGGGLLLRWETNGGTYTEASLRAGMVKNEVGPSLEFAGNRYGFKTENNYYGGHVGIGRIMERDDGDAWDIYGKYFHMHHEGDTVTIAGDEFAFDSVNSDRLRVGARYLDRKNDRFTGYYGLAYEYEFSGDTGGTANHHAMYTPSLQGSTVIGEIGFRGTPGEESPWSFEVSLRGYAGKQEGISGAVTAAYSF